MLHWEVWLDPKHYVGAVAAHPPMVAIAVLLVTWGALMAILTHCLPDLLYTHKHERDFRSQCSLWSAVLGLPLLFLGLFLLFTLATFGIERGLGHTLSFEALFCILVIGCLPKFIVWLSYSVRDLSRLALYLWRIFASLLLLYTIQRLWSMISVADHFTRWHTLLTLIPILLGLGFSGLWELCETPNSLRALFFWRRIRGRRVVVFYPPDKSENMAQLIAQEADKFVSQIEQILNVKPLTLRTEVFLCRSEKDMRRFKKVKGQLAAGYGSPDHITLVYDSWPRIKGLVAHELTHTVTMWRLHRFLNPLLSEGLSEYAMAQIVPEAGRTAICIPLPLGTLAHRGLFYECHQLMTPDYPALAVYAHSAALVDYLVGRYGMEKLKDLCRETAYDADQNQALQFCNAVKNIYGLSVQQLEQEWRREWIESGQIEAGPSGG